MLLVLPNFELRKSAIFDKKTAPNNKIDMRIKYINMYLVGLHISISQ